MHPEPPRSLVPPRRCALPLRLRPLPDRGCLRPCASSHSLPAPLRRPVRSRSNLHLQSTRQMKACVVKVGCACTPANYALKPKAYNSTLSVTQTLT
eukprot:5737063-Pleurochrysis_carterae.AAC.1